MRNFIFQNETSVYFGRGCVREYLGSLCAPYQRVMLVCARGELSRSGIGEGRDADSACALFGADRAAFDVIAGKR